jgi:CRISPR-associated exonuclease Cas4
MVLFENEKIIAAVLAFVCFAAAIYILTSRKSIIKKKADYKMYGCKMIYADSSMGVEDDSVEKGRILYSRKLDIQGKPDFLFKHSITGRIIPVEIKSGAIREEEMPHEGDLMQLCCYFYMASEEFGRKVKYGKIIYSDYMFEIKNTAKLRRKLKKTIIRMRKMLSGSREAANPDYVKCRHCVCAGTVCEYCGIEE